MDDTGQAPQVPSAPAGGNPLIGQRPVTPTAPVAGTATGSEQMEGDDPAWIEKARVVLRRTAGDPYTRQDAMSKLRMMYIKQRFGKTIGEESDQ